MDEAKLTEMKLQVQKLASKSLEQAAQIDELEARLNKLIEMLERDE